MPPFPIFLTSRERLTQDAVHRAVHDWLSSRGGCHDVRYVPSRRRREQVHADVDPLALFGRETETRVARLEVQFEFPPGVSCDYYRIQWIEPDANLSVGWHQDGHRDELGECHLQLDYRDSVVDVHAADFLDSHPLNVLETRLERLPEVLDGIVRCDGTPVFES